MLTVDAGLLHALGHVARNHNISHSHPGHSGTHTLHYSSCLMAENNRENSLRIVSIESVNISVAEGVRNDLNPNLSGSGRVHIDLLHLKGGLGLIGNRSLTFNPLGLAHLN